ncbi:MAG TPA: sporulation protein YabP [Candidatus Onthovicinus excrementipullorum]|nr:sporulation protein YabP [Candidatus Onthovicinus excrementipullorum]
MPEEKKTISLPHNLVLEDRRSLMVSGVSDVDSFDEQTVIVFTEMGELTVRGEQLHINKLSVDTGELSIEGKITSLTYTDDAPRQGGGFFSRVFR